MARISLEKLSDCKMDWHVNNSKTEGQPTSIEMAAALADAVRYYTVKYSNRPTRAWIHSSQVSEALAAVADEMEIQISKISATYNINHIWLSCGQDDEGDGHDRF